MENPKKQSAFDKWKHSFKTLVPVNKVDSNPYLTAIKREWSL